jgi:osmotically-inducible protein OsmY
LTGTVDSEETRQVAEEIARNQPAVMSVVNELKVE